MTPDADLAAAVVGAPVPAEPMTPSAWRAAAGEHPLHVPAPG